MHVYRTTYGRCPFSPHYSPRSSSGYSVCCYSTWRGAAGCYGDTGPVCFSGLCPEQESLQKICNAETTGVCVVEGEEGRRKRRTEVNGSLLSCSSCESCESCSGFRVPYQTACFFILFMVQECQAEERDDAQERLLNLVNPAQSCKSCSIL